MPRTLLILLFVHIACCVAQVQHVQPSCRVNYDPGGMFNEKALNSEFKSSVFILQVHGSAVAGTGYLIDSEGGYILTALHVVNSASSTVAIDVRSPDPSIGALSANLIKSIGFVNPDGTVSGADLALLKLTKPEMVKTLRPVDIILRYPAYGTNLYAMGYPKFVGDLASLYTEQQVRLMATPDDGSIQVAQDTFGGNSGGPLLDSSGSAVGTCRETTGIESVVARYTAMSDAEVILDVIPMSSRMLEIDKEVRSGSINQQGLTALLFKSSRNPTNVELYEWGRRIIANRDQYSSAAVKDLLRCPVLMAIMHRGMDDLVIDLSEFADPTVSGEASLNVARHELDSGRFLSAGRHIQSAARSYALVNDEVGELRAAALLTRVQVAHGSLEKAGLESARVLSNIRLLPPIEQAEALSSAGQIDLLKGAPSGAVSKFNRASELFANSGASSEAGRALMHSADASVKTSHPIEAIISIERAQGRYREAKDDAGQAQSLYRLGIMQTNLGIKAAADDSFKEYLTLAPRGIHASEINETLHSQSSAPSTVALTSAVDAFSGTWLINEQKSQLPAKEVMHFVAVGNGLLKYTDPGLSYIFNPDGTPFQTQPGRTGTFKKVDDNTYESTTKEDDKLLAAATWKLSDDGQTLSIDVEEAKPKNGTFESTHTYARVAGSKGLVGSWQTTERKLSAPNTFTIVSDGEDGVVLYFSAARDFVAAKWDGQDYAVSGPAARNGSTIAVTRISLYRFKLAEKLNGELVDTEYFTVSADGRTLIGKGTNAGGYTEVMDRWAKF